MAGMQMDITWQYLSIFKAAQTLIQQFIFHGPQRDEIWKYTQRMCITHLFIIYNDQQDDEAKSIYYKHFIVLHTHTHSIEKELEIYLWEHTSFSLNIEKNIWQARKLNSSLPPLPSAPPPPSLSFLLQQGLRCFLFFIWFPNTLHNASFSLCVARSSSLTVPVPKALAQLLSVTLTAWNLQDCLHIVMHFHEGNEPNQIHF